MPFSLKCTFFCTEGTFIGCSVVLRKDDKTTLGHDTASQFSLLQYFQSGFWTLIFFFFLRRGYFAEVHFQFLLSFQRIFFLSAGVVTAPEKMLLERVSFFLDSSEFSSKPFSETEDCAAILKSVASEEQKTLGPAVVGLCLPFGCV